MNKPALDAEIAAFIDHYLAVSGLSTATSVAQQRTDYEAVVRQFSYAHPSGITTRDSRLAGRHGDIPLRHYSYGGGDSALEAAIGLSTRASLLSAIRPESGSQA